MAGVDVEIERNQIRREYVNSVFGCDYALCMRGAGNWSYRFVDSLSAGRILVMIDTNCMLPLEDDTDWTGISAESRTPRLRVRQRLCARFSSTSDPMDFPLCKEQIGIYGLRSASQAHSSSGSFSDSCKGA
jgi:hypothetical protein